jgi:hypothetical protein
MAITPDSHACVDHNQVGTAALSQGKKQLQQNVNKWLANGKNQRKMERNSDVHYEQRAMGVLPRLETKTWTGNKIAALRSNDYPPGGSPTGN